MHANEFHRVPIGSKVVACIGTIEHVAKILDKDCKKRKLHLRFNLASGGKRFAWRSSLRCEPIDQSTPMGPTRRGRMTH